jgi:hypothetical protein
MIDGNVIDYDDIISDLKVMAEQFNIDLISYDS